MIGVYATCQVQADKKAEFEALVQRFLQETREHHKGCISYDCRELQDKPNHYCFIERWENQADLEAHLTTEFFRTNAPILVDMLVNGLEINQLNLV